MGEIIVYHSVGETELDAPFQKIIVTKALLKRELTGADEVNIIFDSTTPIDLFIDDYVLFEGRTYRLNYSPKLTKNSESSYNYDLTFEGVASQLKKKI